MLVDSSSTALPTSKLFFFAVLFPLFFSHESCQPVQLDWNSNLTIHTFLSFTEKSTEREREKEKDDECGNGIGFEPPRGFRFRPPEKELINDFLNPVVLSVWPKKIKKFQSC